MALSAFLWLLVALGIAALAILAILIPALWWVIHLNSQLERESRGRRRP